MVDVELKTGEDEIVTTAVPCILPEQILEFLLTKCDLDIDERRCQQYWDHLERHNDEVAVDSKQFRNLQDKQVYPLGIHGDEANMGIISQPYSKNHWNDSQYTNLPAQVDKNIQVSDVCTGKR